MTKPWTTCRITEVSQRVAWESTSIEINDPDSSEVKTCVALSRSQGFLTIEINDVKTVVAIPPEAYEAISSMFMPFAPIETGVTRVELTPITYEGLAQAIQRQLTGEVR